MEQTVQSEDMKKLGKFIKSWIGDMSLEDRNENVESLSKLIEKGGISNPKDILNIPGSIVIGGKSIDYLISYMRLHPEFIPVVLRYIMDLIGFDKILFPDEKGVSTGEELKSSPVATSTSQINNTSLFIQSENLNQGISSLTQLKKNIEKTSGMIEFRAFAADSRFSRKYSERIANIKSNISGLSVALNNINEELNSINSTYKNCETDILNYLNSSFKA